MSEQSTTIVSKVWGMCNPLRDDGVSYGDYLEQLTYLMALMNLYLHNIGDIYGNVPVTQGDSLLTDPGYRVDYVLTNEAVICGLTPEKACNIKEFAA